VGARPHETDTLRSNAISMNEVMPRPDEMERIPGSESRV
jgi:hypothetical protein